MARPKAFDEAAALDRATDLFWKRGYHATSIQDLVDEMGINRASLYATFGGKKELFDRAFAHYRDVNTAGVRKFFAGQKNVRAGIRNLFALGVEESITDQDNKGCFVVNATTELAAVDPQIIVLLQANQQVFEQIFYDFLLAGRGRGEISDRPDLHALAALFYTLYNGIKVQAKYAQDRAGLLTPVDAVLQLLDH